LALEQTTQGNISRNKVRVSPILPGLGSPVYVIVYQLHANMKNTHE
jgi:hypothetical protein